MQAPQIIDITAEVNQIMQQDLPPVTSTAQWNCYTMAPIVNEIGQQAMLMGANGMMIPMPQRPAEEILKQDVIEDANGSVVDDGLKMAAAVAIKIGHAAGKIPFLPKAMPISAITNIVCVGVESFKNIGNVATGKISPLQAMENIGRASVAAIADFCTTGIPARFLAPIPVIVPALSVMVGGFVMQFSPEYIQQKIYAGIDKVKNVAKTVATSSAILSTLSLAPSRILQKLLLISFSKEYKLWRKN